MLTMVQYTVSSKQSWKWVIRELWDHVISNWTEWNKIGQSERNWTKWTKIGQSDRNWTKWTKIGQSERIWKHWLNTSVIKSKIYPETCRKMRKYAKLRKKCDILRETVKSAGWVRLKAQSAEPHLPHSNRVTDYLTI